MSQLQAFLDGVSRKARVLGLCTSWAMAGQEMNAFDVDEPICAQAALVSGPVIEWGRRMSRSTRRCCPKSGLVPLAVTTTCNIQFLLSKCQWRISHMGRDTYALTMRAKK